jgi:hydroxyethylthiazole kinase-like uncharacterized protein yjeF
LLPLNKVPVVTCDESRELDSRASTTNKIPGIALMEEAADAITLQLVNDFPRIMEYGAVVLAGPGNNGGDAIAVARRLFFREIPVSIYFFAGVNGSDLYSTQKSIIETLSCEVRDIKGYDPDSHQDAVVLDGLFGVGYHYREDPDMKTLFEKVNQAPGSVVSIDVPSGLTTESYGISADFTYTIGFPKDIFYEISTRKHCGTIRHLPISFLIANIKQKNRISLVRFPLRRVHPKKQTNLFNRFVHKYSRGAVLVVAGSEAMPGAACLAGNAAIRTGCGYVALLAGDGLIQCQDTPEIVNLPPSKIEKQLKKFNTTVIGPGLDKPSEKVIESIRIITERCSSVICDASFFTLFTPGDLTAFMSPPLLTPHTAEFKRFFGIEAEPLAGENLGSVVHRLAKKYNCHLLVKDSFLLLASPGKEVLVVDHPCRLAAQAGSGDIISGIIASINSQGIADLPDSALIALDLFYRALDQFEADNLVSYPAMELINRVAGMVKPNMQAGADVS